MVSTKLHHSAPGDCPTCDLHLSALKEYARRLDATREALYATSEQGRCDCRPMIVTVAEGERMVHKNACFLQQVRKALRMIDKSDTPKSDTPEVSPYEWEP